MRYKQFPGGRFYVGDCLDIMPEFRRHSISMVLCDLPYGTTACAWDAIIPFKPLWKQYWRLCGIDSAVVLTASQPFTTAMIGSQLDRFKYEWIWEKSRPTGHQHAKNKPMKKHENVLVFSKGTTIHVGQSENRMRYYPQGVFDLAEPKLRKGSWKSRTYMTDRPSHRDTLRTQSGYPSSILRFTSVNHPQHPTQKPVELFEYLIRTYTQPGDIVLDNCAGSGTTAIAAINSDRRWVCIEKDKEYAAAAIERISKHIEQRKSGLFGR